jgi:hypothetical protein
MRSKLPFFLALALSATAVLVFNAEASAQWQNDKRKIEKHQQRTIIRRDVRPAERVIVVRPGSSSSAASRTNTFYRNDVYTGNDRYYEGNTYGNIAQIARLNGYEDGLYEGTKDARDGDRYDPFGEHGYDDGAEGYKSRYGNKAAYKQIYRQGFIRGYKEAFDRYLGDFRERKW